MRKTNLFHKYLNNISYSINKLLENNLNKLSSKNLTNLARSNKTILTFVALLLLFITYLSIPSFFKQNEQKHPTHQQEKLPITRFAFQLKMRRIRESMCFL